MGGYFSIVCAPPLIMRRPFPGSFSSGLKLSAIENLSVPVILKTMPARALSLKVDLSQTYLRREEKQITTPHPDLGLSHKSTA